MTRLEENGMVVDIMTKRAEHKSTGAFDEMVVFQLGMIATMLTDISRSLAVIADKAESERMTNEETLKQRPTAHHIKVIDEAYGFEESYHYECSACKSKRLYGDEKFCPDCGAKMH